MPSPSLFNNLNNHDERPGGVAAKFILIIAAFAWGSNAEQNQNIHGVLIPKLYRADNVLNTCTTLLPDSRSPAPTLVYLL
jgi:hypothetical protein